MVICTVNCSAQLYKNEFEKGKMLDSFYTENLHRKDLRESVYASMQAEYKRTRDNEILLYEKFLKQVVVAKTDITVADNMRLTVEDVYKDYPNTRARVYYFLGQKYLHSQNFEKAFDMYFKVEELLEKYTYKTITAYSTYYQRIGEAYYQFRNYKKAINYILKGSENPLLEFDKWEFYNTVGLAYKELNLLDSSTYYFQKALAEIKDKKSIHATVSLGNIGYNYYLKNDYTKAQPLLELDFKNALEYREFALAAGAAIPLADIFISRKEFNTADSLLKKARCFINVSTQVSRLEKYYPVMGNYYAANKNFELAALYKDSAIRAIRFNDSVFSNLYVMHAQQRNSLAKIAEEQERLAVYKKLTTARIIGIGSVLILCGIILFLVLKYRNRIKKDNQKIEELNRILAIRQKLSADMHDDIGSTLSSISIYTHSLLIQPQIDAQKKVLEKIRDNTQSVQQNMSDIIWSVNPDMDNAEHVFARMRSFGAGITESAGVGYVFNEDQQLHRFSLPMDIRKHLYFIYKEAINNAVKYSGCKTITVNIILVNDNILSINIKDDGKGFDINKKPSGNGLINMSRRAADINAALIINSGFGYGTEIILKMQLPV